MPLDPMVRLGQCPICESRAAEKYFAAPDRFYQRETLYQLMQCRSCSLVWLGNPPRPEDMYMHYGAEYHEEITNAGEGYHNQRWAYPRKKILNLVREGALLDIGCSAGGFLSTLKTSRLKLYGIEMSSSEARKAIENSGAQVWVGEISDAPFPPLSFDVITGFHVLEHVLNPTETIDRLLRWLKPGGILYLHVPNIEALEARVFQSFWYGLELPRHLYHFSPTSLKGLFTRFAFQEVSIATLPENHIERSMNYVGDHLKRRYGLISIPRPMEEQPTLAWRVVRRGLRATLLVPLSYLASAVGRGATIEAIFRKCA